MNPASLAGAWAVVTGASSGIGLEFARQLAQRGLHLALVARSSGRLDELAGELATRHAVRTLPLSLDLGLPDAAARLRAALDAEGIRPRLLVNNAGVGRWGRFEGADLAVHHCIAAVNALATLELCRVFLPELAEQAPSAIVNLSSPAALQPMPYMATYAASKAFVHSLSLALHEEWRDRGVYVQTLVPGPTATDFDRRAGAYASAIGAKRAPPGAVVDAALRAFADELPLVTAASGTYGQRLFAGLAPTRFMLRKLGTMFRPPRSD